MKDYIVRASAANAQIRAFAAVTTELTEEARKRHETSPVATAALGRLLTGGAMMGSMMKNDTDMLTIQIKCSGPIGGLTVTADSKGNVKGYVHEPNVILPPKNGKLDVGGALGQGVRTDDSSDRGNRGRSDVLFRYVRTGSVFRRVGRSHGKRQYGALCRRIHCAGNAVYRR